MSQNGSNEADDDGCNICCHHTWVDDNKIVYCDGLDECYGIHKIPRGKWFCAPCKRDIPQKQRICSLCEQSHPDEMWSMGDDSLAHAICVLYCYRAVDVASRTVTPAGALERGKHMCVICNRRVGVTLPCAVAGCALRMHASCARREQLLSDSPTTDPAETFRGYCTHHRDLRVLADLHTYVHVIEIDIEETHEEAHAGAHMAAPKRGPAASSPTPPPKRSRTAPAAASPTTAPGVARRTGEAVPKSAKRLDGEPPTSMPPLVALPTPAPPPPPPPALLFAETPVSQVAPAAAPLPTTSAASLPTVRTLSSSSRPPAAASSTGDRTIPAGGSLDTRPVKKKASKEATLSNNVSAPKRTSSGAEARLDEAFGAVRLVLKDAHDAAAQERRRAEQAEIDYEALDKKHRKMSTRYRRLQDNLSKLFELFGVPEQLGFRADDPPSVDNAVYNLAASVSQLQRGDFARVQAAVRRTLDSM